MGYKGIKERPSEKKRLANQEIHKKLRQRALDRYYANPNLCKHCGKIIEVPEGKLIASTRAKQFCDHSCAARFNNQGKDRWESARGFKQRVRKTSEGSTKVCICEVCGVDIVVEPKRRPDGQKGYWYYDRKFCDVCLADFRRNKIIERAKKNGYTTYFDKIENGLTLGQLKDLFKGKGYYWFRSTISGHARRVIKNNNRELKCQVCGFDFHVDVCHKKDVADHRLEEKILDINANSNLIVLCPNHHIMFDKKALRL